MSCGLNSNGKTILVENSTPNPLSCIIMSVSISSKPTNEDNITYKVANELGDGKRQDAVAGEAIKGYKKITLKKQPRTYRKSRSMV